MSEEIMSKVSNGVIVIGRKIIWSTVKNSQKNDNQIREVIQYEELNIHCA